MDVHERVIEHFDRRDLSTTMLDALRRTGVDVDHLAPLDLSPVDQLHAGGADTAKRVMGLAGVGGGARLLDVGCGVGGVARMAAAAGADVDGVDLTPSMIEAAEQLTARVGLSERARFQLAAVESMPYDDDTFDAATMLHVAMNVFDKTAAFADVHRVLRPRAPFVVYEQMRTGQGDLTYPLPWALDDRISFIETPEQYAEHLESAGFTVVSVEDHTPPEPHLPAGLGPGVVLGPDFEARVENNIRATQLVIV